jgi:hypothetical protein
MATKFLTFLLEDSKISYGFYDDLLHQSAYLRRVVKGDNMEVRVPCDTRTFYDVDKIMRSGGTHQGELYDAMKTFSCLLFLEVEPTIIYKAYSNKYKNEHFDLIYKADPSLYMFRIIERFVLISEIPYCKDGEKYLAFMSKAKASYIIKSFVEMTHEEALYCGNYVDASTKFMAEAHLYFTGDRLSQLQKSHQSRLEYVM